MCQTLIGTIITGDSGNQTKLVWGGVGVEVCPGQTLHHQMAQGLQGGIKDVNSILR